MQPTRNFLDIVFSCGTLIFCTILFVCIAPLLAISIMIWPPIKNDNRFFYLLEMFFFKGVVASTFLSCTVVGRKNLIRGPAIIVVNHSSSLDIPVVASILRGRPTMWYIFKRYAEWPIIGFFVRRSLLVVHQNDHGKDARAVVAGIQTLKMHNRYLVIFPEGGRFPDRAIHEFKHGFAFIARKAACPVIPIHLANLGAIFPPGALFLRRLPIHILIGLPFYRFADESDALFAQRVQQWFEVQDC